MAKDEDETPLLGQLRVEGSSSKLYIKDYVAWLVSFIMVCLGVAGIIVVCVYQTRIKYEYSVVLDAGSTHTDLMVYRWSRKDIIHKTGLVEQIGQCASQRGSISSYSTTDPSKAGSSFQSCIDDTAKNLIPSYLHDKSPIYLGATAGMRLIEEESKAVADAIMQSVRQTLHKSSFRFEDDFARIITGEEEGLSSWVTVNYLTGKLLYREILANKSSQESNKNLIGALDMGGASTQITFTESRHDVIPPKNVQQLRLFGRTYNLYTHSYLCYGKKEAERRFLALLLVDKLAKVHINRTLENPCGPLGLSNNVSIKYLTRSPCVDAPSSGWHINGSYVTFIGTSNISQCINFVQKLFNFSNCSPNNCSFNGVYQPSSKGIQFVAFSSFYYLINDFNMTGDSNVTLRKFQEATDKICRQTWSQIQKGRSPKQAQMLKTVCFDGHYIYTLLNKGYHISDDSLQIQFANKIHDRSLGWALGFMINATNLIRSEDDEYRVKTEAFLAVIFVGAILISLGVLLLIMATRKAVDRWKFRSGIQA